MASLKDLAAECGVSIATVSKALNGQKDVSPKTRERIRQKAREIGYFPNSAAKALKTNESKNIGVLFVDDARSGLTHDYFNHVLDSFKREIELQDYDLTLINCTRTSASGMTCLERARYRGFDGVIIACINFKDPEVAELVASEIPVVTIDYIFNNTLADHDYITADEAYTMERGNAKYTDDDYTRSTSVNSKVAIISPSDYGFASSACYRGDGQMSLSNYFECTSSNWMYNGQWTWMLSHLSNLSGEAWVVGGNVSYDTVGTTYGVRPTVYLISDISLSGSGTSSDPYKIIK